MRKKISFLATLSLVLSLLCASVLFVNDAYAAQPIIDFQQNYYKEFGSADNNAVVTNAELVTLGLPGGNAIDKKGYAVGKDGGIEYKLKIANHVNSIKVSSFSQFPQLFLKVKDGEYAPVNGDASTPIVNTDAWRPSSWTIDTSTNKDISIKLGVPEYANKSHYFNISIVDVNKKYMTESMDLNLLGEGYAKYLNTRAMWINGFMDNQKDPWIMMQHFKEGNGKIQYSHITYEFDVNEGLKDLSLTYQFTHALNLEYSLDNVEYKAIAGDIKVAGSGNTATTNLYDLVKGAKKLYIKVSHPMDEEEGVYENRFIRVLKLNATIGEVVVDADAIKLTDKGYYTAFNKADDKAISVTNSEIVNLGLPGGNAIDKKGYAVNKDGSIEYKFRVDENTNSIKVKSFSQFPQLLVKKGNGEYAPVNGDKTTPIVNTDAWRVSSWTIDTTSEKNICIKLAKPEYAAKSHYADIYVGDPLTNTYGKVNNLNLLGEGGTKFLAQRAMWVNGFMDNQKDPWIMMQHFKEGNGNIQYSYMVYELVNPKGLKDLSLTYQFTHALNLEYSLNNVDYMPIEENAKVAGGDAKTTNIYNLVKDINKFYIRVSHPMDEAEGVYENRFIKQLSLDANIEKVISKDAIVINDGYYYQNLATIPNATNKVGVTESQVLGLPGGNKNEIKGTHVDPKGYFEIPVVVPDNCNTLRITAFGNWCQLWTKDINGEYGDPEKLTEGTVNNNTDCWRPFVWDVDTTGKDGIVLKFGAMHPALNSNFISLTIQVPGANVLDKTVMLNGMNENAMKYFYARKLHYNLYMGNQIDPFIFLFPADGVQPDATYEFYNSKNTQDLKLKYEFDGGKAFDIKYSLDGKEFKNITDAEISYPKGEINIFNLVKDAEKFYLRFENNTTTNLFIKKFKLIVKNATSDNDDDYTFNTVDKEYYNRIDSEEALKAFKTTGTVEIKNNFNNGGIPSKTKNNNARLDVNSSIAIAFDLDDAVENAKLVIVGGRCDNKLNAYKTILVRPFDGDDYITVDASRNNESIFGAYVFDLNKSNALAHGSRKFIVKLNAVDYQLWCESIQLQTSEQPVEEYLTKIQAGNPEYDRYFYGGTFNHIYLQDYVNKTVALNRQDSELIFKIPFAPGLNNAQFEVNSTFPVKVTISTDGNEWVTPEGLISEGNPHIDTRWTIKDLADTSKVNTVYVKITPPVVEEGHKLEAYFRWLNIYTEFGSGKLDYEENDYGYNGEHDYSDNIIELPEEPKTPAPEFIEDKKEDKPEAKGCGSATQASSIVIFALVLVSIIAMRKQGKKEE